MNNAGFQAAGSFTKAGKQMQTGVASDQMIAIDKQMEALLEKMQRHNQCVGAQHHDFGNTHKARLFHKLPKLADQLGSMRNSAAWPAKINLSLFNKVTSSCSSR